jgi:hypothetical protein
MSRRLAAALIGVVLAIAPATMASASPNTLITTTTTLKATQHPGNTPGKITFSGRVVPASGAIPTGTVKLTVDAGTPVVLTVRSNGFVTYTHHYKAGSHTAVATYSGSLTDATSTVTITFTVTIVT